MADNPKIGDVIEPIEVPRPWVLRISLDNPRQVAVAAELIAGGRWRIVPPEELPLTGRSESA